MRIMDDIDVLSNFIGDQIVSYIYGILLFLFTIVASVRISWQMTLFCLLILPIVFIVDSMIGNGQDVLMNKYGMLTVSIILLRTIRCSFGER